MSFKKLKIFVAITLFVVALLFESMVLIAYSDVGAFPYLFLLISLFLITIFIAYPISKLDKSEIIVIILCALLMLATITFFANGVKLYSDTSQQMGTLEQQINSISSTNNYYQTYRAALSEAIEKSQANSVALQKKINNLNSQISQKDSATEPSVIQPVINLVTQEFEEEDD